MPMLSTCSECGAEIPVAAPQGVCTRCLFSLGLSQRDQAKPPAAALDAAPSGREANRQESDTGGEDSPFANPRRVGDYELLEEIARGGMGVVYRARQISLDRIVAVKMILAGQFASREQVLRFRAEAEASARLQHPGIVAIQQTSEHEGRPFFSMDYVTGGNLTSLVRDRPLSGKPAAALVKTLAEAVHYAHDQGVLHRDLKPTNILLDEASRPRITDFGLAKREQKDAFLTMTGQVLGSPNFMPPEQAGSKPGRAGRYSDVYALRGILFYLVTGRPPFLAGTVTETLQEVLNTDAVSPRLLNPSVPLDLATICLKCLEKEPARRYATAQELADELGRFVRDEPIRARPANAAEKAWRWCRRKPALAASLSLAALLLIVVAIGAPIAFLRIAAAREEAEQNRYVANMHQGIEALQSHDLGRARDLLQRIESSPQQRSMRGWEWRYLKQRCRSDEMFTLGRHDSWVAGLAVSPDRHWLATISEDGVAKLWNVEIRQQTSWAAHANLAKHRSEIPRHALTFTPDGARLVTAGYDGAIRFWKVLSGQRPEEIKGQEIEGLTEMMVCLAVSPDGRLLAGGDPRGKLTLWSLSEKAPESLKSWPTDLLVLLALDFSPDGKTLFAGAVAKPVQRFDIADPRAPRELPSLPRSAPPLAFSPDGQWLATGGESHRVMLWALPECKPMADLRVQGGSVATLAFSGSESLLAASSGDGTINLLDMSGAAKPVILHGHEDAIRGLGFIRLGAELKLASASWDKTVRVWHPATRERAIQHEGRVLAVQFSPEAHSRRLATVADAAAAAGHGPREAFTLRLWETGTWSPGASATVGREGLSPEIVFSRDGQQIAASHFLNLRIYAIPSLAAVTNVGERCAVYAPDGRWPRCRRMAARWPAPARMVPFTFGMRAMAAGWHPPCTAMRRARRPSPFHSTAQGSPAPRGTGASGFGTWLAGA